MEVRLVRSLVVWMSKLKTVTAGALTAIALTGIPAIAPAKSAQLSQPNFLLAQRLVCRQVVREGGTPFYRNLPQPNSFYEYLNQGTKVGIIPGQQLERAPDGRFYIRVAYPFNSNNPLNGYVPEQYQTQNGSFRRTLGACRIMW